MPEDLPQTQEPPGGPSSATDPIGFGPEDFDGLGARYCGRGMIDLAFIPGIRIAGWDRHKYFHPSSHILTRAEVEALARHVFGENGLAEAMSGNSLETIHGFRGEDGSRLPGWVRVARSSPAENMRPVLLVRLNEQQPTNELPGSN